MAALNTISSHEWFINHLDQWLNRLSVYCLKWIDKVNSFHQRFLSVFPSGSDDSEQTVVERRRRHKEALSHREQLCGIAPLKQGKSLLYTSIKRQQLTYGNHLKKKSVVVCNIDINQNMQNS